MMLHQIHGVPDLILTVEAIETCSGHKMMRGSAMEPSGQTLVLGIGNTLLGDDGFGVHVANLIAASPDLGPNVAVRDGGTLGLTLLPDIEDSERLIVIDAGEIGSAPGTMQVLFGDEMDAHLGRCKGTVHAVALADLIGAARLTGRVPGQRALVLVQPEHVGWGDGPSAPVAAAIPKACDAVRSILGEWPQ